MKQTIINFIFILFVVINLGAVPNDSTYPQSLLITQSGFRNQENILKAKYFFMATIAGSIANIKKVKLTLEEIDGASVILSNEFIVPVNYEGAMKTKNVVSFYTTRNIIYIGVGDFDLYKKYRCKISFIDKEGKSSQTSTYSN